MKSGSVVGIPWGGGDTQIQPNAKKLFELFAPTEQKNLGKIGILTT